MQQIENLKSLLSPKQLEELYPLSISQKKIIYDARSTTKNIIKGLDKRLLVIVGPCSIHDYAATFEYAELLASAIDIYKDKLFIIMRSYFEKPRTILGWKGLIRDPHLDESFDINFGLKLARKILLNLVSLGIPAATEFLDPFIPQYISDLITWTAIGARTSESQLHREIASGLNMPVGFKNSTDGNIQVAIDAVLTAQKSHHYLGISKNSIPSIIKTKGNDCCHIILRGSKTTTNYKIDEVSNATRSLESQGLNPRVLIDCNHGNSGESYLNQKLVIETVINQLKNNSIFGVMLESFIIGGKQELGKKLVYGKSITDACLSFKDTMVLLQKLYDAHTID